jgi:hypothetical protein
VPAVRRGVRRPSIVRCGGCRRIVLCAGDFLGKTLRTEAPAARFEPLGGQRRHGAAPAVGCARLFSAVERAAAARATPAFRLARFGPARRGGRSGGSRIHNGRMKPVRRRANDATSGRRAEPDVQAAQSRCPELSCPFDTTPIRCWHDAHRARWRKTSPSLCRKPAARRRAKTRLRGAQRAPRAP